MQNFQEILFTFIKWKLQHTNLFLFLCFDRTVQSVVALPAAFIMITPAFELSQDPDFLTIIIDVPYARASEFDLYFEGEDFKFYSKPYFLRQVVEAFKKKKNFGLHQIHKNQQKMNFVWDISDHSSSTALTFLTSGRPFFCKEFFLWIHSLCFQTLSHLKRNLNNCFSEFTIPQSFSCKMTTWFFGCV